MPKLSYAVRDKFGKKTTGHEEAASKEELTARLQSRGLFVIDIALEDQPKEGSRHSGLAGAGRSKRKLHGGVNNEDLALFCRQLATLLGAGVTLLKCLDIVSQQVASRKLQAVLIDLRKNMEQGSSLHEAMGKHSKIFSELWVNLVESGEAGGNLAIVLGRLASYLERNASFKKKIISALIYPAILFVAGSGALLFLTLKIIPTFAELFKNFNIQLPWLTQVIIMVSDFLRKYFIIIIAVIIGAYVFFMRYIKTKEGRFVYEKLLFKLPVFGEFFKALIVERFSSNMSTLLESGVPILYCLEITERSVDNLVMADLIHAVKEDVRQGRSLGAQLEQSGFFEPMVVQMVHIGEEIGELPQMFKKINAFYQEYVETFLARFTAMFEPIMLVFMGFVVGVMVVGMFLPIFQLTRLGSSG